MKLFYLYMLECEDGSYYIGHTDDLEKRLAEHQDGLHNCYTYSRRPLKLVFYQEFKSRAEALERERQIKGWSRAKKKALISGDWEKISKLSKGKDHPSTGSG